MAEDLMHWSDEEEAKVKTQSQKVKTQSNRHKDALEKLKKAAVEATFPNMCAPQSDLHCTGSCMD